MVAPLEAADSQSPHTIGLKRDDARTTALYYIAGPEFAARSREIIGSNAVGSDGRIARTLPRAHPQLPFLFSSSVNLRGAGLTSVTESDASSLASPIDDSYGLYAEYDATVEFLQRPYHVVPDQQIDVVTDGYFDEYGDIREFKYAEEWLRFVDIEESYDPKIITAQQGQLLFRTNDGRRPGGEAFAGTPRIPFPEQTLTVKWYEVPLHYVTHRNSYLKRLAHRVNQRAFRFDGYYEFEPGELLYVGYKYRRYTVPFPAADAAVPGGYALEKWCDVELSYSVARRSTPSPPELPNGNWVANGHNVLPWFGPGQGGGTRRASYYVCSFLGAAPEDRRHWAPIYESAPLELVFMDPAVAQPPGFVLDTV